MAPVIAGLAGALVVSWRWAPRLQRVKLDRILLVLLSVAVAARTLAGAGLLQQLVALAAALQVIRIAGDARPG